MLAACSVPIPIQEEADVFLLDARPAVSKAPTQTGAVLAVATPRA